VVHVKVTRNYQITIPALIRERVGDYVEIYVDDKGRIIVEKVRVMRRTLRLGRDLSPEEIEELIERGFRRSL